ncbi:MAG TPA: twin-arginine translocase TatA/TatE family subunit [Gemmatimonadales bacterium]|nr:twin-arginine translocase TatA/TatE family subunit [Gemmatimonadales bacterium]
MPFNLGMSELLVILALVLLVFGAKRLPEIGASMGKGIREFKRSLKEVQDSIDSGPNEITPPTRRLEGTPTPTGTESGEPKKLVD